MMGDGGCYLHLFSGSEIGIENSVTYVNIYQNSIIYYKDSNHEINIRLTFITRIKPKGCI